MYFGFEFTQLYKTFDGEIHIDTDNYKKDYICSTQYDDMYKRCVESKSDMYDVKDC